MKKFFAALVASILLFTASGYAQDSLTRVREVGLRTDGFNNLGMIYKKQVSENTYRRYRAAIGNVSATFQERLITVGLVAGGAIGKEKRKNLTEKLQAVYGTEFIANVNITSVTVGPNNLASDRDSYHIINPSVGIGLVLGAQYNFTPKWYVSTELNPSLTVNGVFSQGTSAYNVNAGFSSSSVGITGAYRF
jgi:hypothetical protein